MCKRKLARKTSTADSRIGSHNDVRPTIRTSSTAGTPAVGYRAVHGPTSGQQQSRINDEQVYANVALARAQNTPVHQELVDRVERPENGDIQDDRRPPPPVQERQRDGDPKREQRIRHEYRQ